MGVTQRTFNAYRTRKNLPYKDVKYITKEEATNLYYEDFWKPCGADEVDDPKLAIAIFDTSVLHGIYDAKRFYKQSDGTVEDFLNIRQRSYDKTVIDYPSQIVFYDGWNNRVNDLRKTLNVSTVSPMKRIKKEIESNRPPYSLQEIAHPEFSNPFVNYNNVKPEDLRVYTFEELKKMPYEEIRRNQQKILKAFTTGKMLHENEAKEKVKSGELIYVESYTRQDGTKVSGYYRRR